MADNVEIRFGAVTDGSLTSVPKEAQAAVRSVSDSVSATAAAAKTGTRDISGLSTAMADIRSVSTSSAQALKQAGHSMEEVGGATAAVKRQMIVLAHEAISGNFSQMPGSFIVLAEQSKTLHAAMEAMFTALASPPIAALTAFSAVMGVIGIKAAEAAHFMHELRVEMAATGNSYLFNPAEIERAIEGMKEFGYTESHAREAVTELRSAVRLHNNELQQAERLLPDLSAKMGSAANAAKFLKTAIDDPARALSALRAEMERNDPDALRLIDDMLRLGDTAGATRAELDYLTRSTRGLAEEGMTFLDKALQGTIALLGGQLPNAIRVAKESVEGFLGTLRMMSAGDLFRNTSTGNLIPYVRQAIEAKDLIQQARTGAEAGFSIVSTAAIETMKDMNVELARGDALTRQLKTDSSELLQWQDKLAAAQRALSAANATGDKNRAAEQTQNIAAIEARIGEVKRRAAEESLRDQLQTIDQEMDAHKAGSAERVRIARQELDLVRRTEGEKGSLYRETLNKLRAEQRAFTEEQRQSRIADLEGIRSLAEQDFGIQEQGIQLKRQLGQISATQEMQDLRRVKQQEYQIEFLALQQQQKLWEKGSKEYQKIQNQILILQRRHQLQMQQITAQSVTQQQQKWLGFFNSIKGSFNSSILGMIQGTQTFGQAVGNVFLSLGESIFGILEDIAAKWLVTELIGETASKAQGAAGIAASAAQAGAAAYASTAAIPIVGPELAPAAAAAAYAGAISYEGLLSFDVGAWDLPSDTVARVHKGETIMPKTFAEGFRENGGFGGGGEINVSIQAWDGHSVGRWLKNNKHLLADAVASAHRDGNRSLRG